MKVGDIIRFTNPVSGRQIVASVEELPTEKYNFCLVRESDGQPHLFNPHFIDWEIVADTTNTKQN